MTRRADLPKSRADFHSACGVLLVTRKSPPPTAPSPGQPPTVQANPLEGDEILLAVWDDGSVTALHGHVDLGTGIATALAQIVADRASLNNCRSLDVFPVGRHIRQHAPNVPVGDQALLGLGRHVAGGRSSSPSPVHIGKALKCAL